MKFALVIMIGLALPVAAAAVDAAQRDAELREAMLLTLSEEFSKCAGYYEITAAALRETKSRGVRKASRNKKAALVRAIAMAETYEGKQNARIIADKNYEKAVEHINAVANDDPKQFKKLLDDYRTKCRVAIDDWRTFIQTVQAEHRKPPPPAPNVAKFGKVSVAELMKHGKPVTEVSRRGACSEADEEVRISLNDVLVDNDMLCAEHDKHVCDGNGLWVHPKTYVEQLHPNRTVLNYSRQKSVTIKNGQTERNNELVACLAAPAFGHRSSID